MIYPVILSGGSGSRLWPVSRAMFPKQFLALHGDNPMLAETALRFCGDGFATPSVICNEAHRFMVAQCLSDAGLEASDIILEPVGRNTAPAVTVSALNVLAKDPDGLLLVLPSDHVIAKVDGFIEKVRLAAKFASAGKLITFGIEPGYPETGYGYIKAGRYLDGLDEVHEIEAFFEKPDEPTAKQYLSHGGFYWNSGMFLFSARHVIEEMTKVAPDVVELSQRALAEAQEDLDFLRLAKGPFEQMPDDSVDYVLMEKTKSGAIVPVNIGWNDLGSWSSLWDVAEKDSNGNAFKGDVFVEDVQNSLIHTDQGSIACVIGLEDVIVVNDDDVVLVAQKERAQDVKKIVAQLKVKSRNEVLFHSTVYRPWGSYKTIDSGPGYLVKTISVRPGCALSLQYHNHRAEHWVVVSGEAKVQRGEETLVLRENQSTYIPLGTVHRLENTTEDDLHMIEVQSGQILSEDDIVRLEDLYGRKA